MRRREAAVFSLSFLDVMSCGFGAIVLVYLIINHATEVDVRRVNDDLYAEIRKLDYEVETGQVDLAELRQSLTATERRLADARNRRAALVQSLAERSESLTTMQADTMARIEHLNRLKSDVEAREKDVERLKAKSEEKSGSRVRTFAGEGDRQYLTGLKMGGERILIALDTSASMLDETLVNVIRRRNMNDARKQAAPKWQRAIATVEWLTAQLPLDSQFQIYGFSTAAKPFLTGSEKRWLDVTSQPDIEGAIEGLKETIPTGGTNLHALIAAIETMTPPPDNIVLIVDGLPTQGARAVRGATVTGRQRMDFFGDAVEKLPANIPVNVILFPLEGDPLAAAAYWGLAHMSRGSFLSPSKDWP